MWELSYWLFPLIFLVFFFMKQTQYFLLPGLLAACIAGSANSIVKNKYPYAWGHALAAIIFIFIWKSNQDCKNQDCKNQDNNDKLFAVVGWATTATTIVYYLPSDWWPYAFNKSQMLQLFLMYLPIGVL